MDLYQLVYGKKDEKIYYYILNILLYDIDTKSN